MILAIQKIGLRRIEIYRRVFVPTLPVVMRIFPGSARGAGILFVNAKEGPAWTNAMIVSHPETASVEI